MSLNKNIKACTSAEGAACSSTTRNDKHQITPLKVKSKSSKFYNDSDVHTLNSTPDAQSSRFHNDFRSPTSSIPFSQDSLPEVVWDYTSPKIARGGRRREINMTVDEFLKNMYHDSVPECTKHVSNYIELLEKWMTTNETALVAKPPVIKRRENGRKNSRRFIDEMKQYLESIQIEKGGTENKAAASSSDVCNGHNSDSNEKENLDEKYYFWGDDEFDSSDELWCDFADSDSVIVKATQDPDSCSVTSSPGKKSASPLVHTIPETLSPSSSANSKCSTVPTTKSNTCSVNSNVSNSESTVSDFDLLKDFEECDDWDDEFLLEDESTLSSIPDSILQGIDLNQPQSDNSRSATIFSQDTHDSNDKSYAMTLNESEFVFAGGKSQVRGYCKMGENNDRPKLVSENCTLSKSNSSKMQKSSKTWDIVDDNSLELFGIKVESQLSQNQKCTAIEIAQKKDEALKRRQKNLRTKKSLSRKKL